MTEDELKDKRQEFRDSEVQKKIDNFGEEDKAAKEAAGSNAKVVIVKRGKKGNLGTMGWTLVITQATGILFFSTLFILSYLPKTKFIVNKILP